jgi:hypothetical protein
MIYYGGFEWDPRRCPRRLTWPPALAGIDHPREVLGAAARDTRLTMTCFSSPAISGVFWQDHQGCPG